MPDELPDIFVYAFCYPARAPRNHSQMRENAAIRAQLASVSIALYGSPYRIQGTKLSYSSSRSNTFCETREFRALQARAKTISASIVLDLNALLRVSRPESLESILVTLDNSPVELLDSSTGTRWSAWSKHAKMSLARSAGVASRTRSTAIKDGLKKSVAARSPAPGRNRQNANYARSQRAQRIAESLRGFVVGFLLGLKPGELISPTRLSTALNEAGIPPARAGKWSHNAAKNLLLRLSLP